MAGKTTMLATDRWLLAAGQLALGYSVNETDPAKMAEVRDLLIDAKGTLLAYDDTTFYAKLVSGEAELVQAWDGWCNYGIGENADIKYMIPEEGSDLWVDTMVILKASENKDAAYEFVNFILDADNHRWAAENILYKVPNEAAMAGVDPSLIETFPNMGMTPADMLKFEQLARCGRSPARLFADRFGNQGRELTAPPCPPGRSGPGVASVCPELRPRAGEGPPECPPTADPCF